MNKPHTHLFVPLFHDVGRGTAEQTYLTGIIHMVSVEQRLAASHVFVGRKRLPSGGKNMLTVFA